MQCEICGAEVSGKLSRIVIDGSMLEVCKNCERFGEAESKWSSVPKKVVPLKRAFRTRRPAPRDAFRDLVEIVPEYGRVVREGRERLGLTPEELGLRIKEKSSLILKIERHELIPEDSVRKKLEKELKIKLTDEASDADWKPGRGGKGLTLGDIASIKRK
jgi:putative transcription factor